VPRGRADDLHRGGQGASAPADAFLAADAGTFSALRGEDVGVAGIGVAPAQVAVQRLGLRGMAAVVGVGQCELPQRAEVRLDRVGPGGVGRGEAQFDLVLLRPAADVYAGVGGEVVQNDVDRGAVGPGRTDRLQGGEAVGGALAAVVDASQPIVADGVTAVEVGDAVGAAVGCRQPVGHALPRPAGTCGRPDPERAELVEGEDPVREVLQYMLDAVEFGVAVGSGDSFHVLVRWKVMPRRRSRHRKASLPMWMTCPWTRRR
jgi:hypothetical protein